MILGNGIVPWGLGETEEHERQRKQFTEKEFGKHKITKYKNGVF